MTASAPPRCIFGHLVTGRFFRYDPGGVVCAQHEAEGRRCARCGVPSPSLKAVGRLEACPLCVKAIPRCSLCGEATLWTRSLRDRPDRVYCRACAFGKEACDFCGHPGAKPVGDGRGACSACRGEFVRDPALAEHLYRQVREAVAKHCGIQVRSKLGFAVLTPSEMAKRAGTVFSATHAMDQRPLGLFTRRGDERSLFLEGGLPKTILICTCAHELGHAWQSEYCDRAVIPLLAEGFSEWVAHRIAMKARFREEARRIETRQDVYGEGFKVVMSLVRKVGIDAMLKVVRDRLERGVARV
jgi:hypothetical protein